jgi:hypothetical protein
MILIVPLFYTYPTKNVCHCLGLFISQTPTLNFCPSFAAALRSLKSPNFIFRSFSTSCLSRFPTVAVVYNSALFFSFQDDNKPRFSEQENSDFEHCESTLPDSSCRRLSNTIFFCSLRLRATNLEHYREKSTAFNFMILQVHNRIK